MMRTLPVSLPPSVPPSCAADDPEALDVPPVAIDEPLAPGVLLAPPAGVPLVAVDPSVVDRVVDPDPLAWLPPVDEDAPVP
jgi:hypothetical protein